MQAATFIGLSAEQQRLVRTLNRRKRPTRCAGHALRTAAVLVDKGFIRLVGRNYEGRKLVALWVKL